MSKAIEKTNLQEQHGQFKKSVGYWTGRKGSRTERVWWLGNDRQKAETTALALVSQWATVKREGRDVWGDADIQAVCHFSGADLDWKFDDGGTFKRTAAKDLRTHSPVFAPLVNLVQRFKPQFYGMVHGENATAAAEAPTPAVSLAAALDAYSDSIKAQPGSDKYKGRLVQSVAALKYYLGELSLAAVELAAVDRTTLETITNYIKSRPLSRNKQRGEKKPQKIAANTVKTLLQHWRQGFDWLDSQADSDRFGHWTAPRRWTELFDPELTKIRTKAERDAAADGPVQMTLAEFVAVYKAATLDTHKMVLLAGLFSAQGQTELAVSRRDELDLKAGKYSHRRNKTGQPGTYWMPPQLVKLVQSHWKEAGANGLAFTTSDGQPLVHGATDSVVLMWNDLRDRAAVAGTPIRDGITFYSLRRYFGHRAKMAGGTDLRNAALSHSGKEVGDRSYSNHRDFKAVEKIGRAIHRELVAAKCFT